MAILSKLLRRQLETAIKQAREIADDAAREVIARIGVADAQAPLHLSEDSKALRRRLRAYGRTLGDIREGSGAMTTARLRDAAAYEFWHRMLFGRFLVERGLLMHPALGAKMSVADLSELAQEEGAADEWALAEQYAAAGLPGVFKPDDPVLAMQLAPEFSMRLRAVLSGLPEEVFAADDSLGWTYQFWRAAEKDAVNQAGGKIGALELPAVTQLFTESYMVRFLLHNTLGAWWAGKVLAADPALARDAEDETALRKACSLPEVSWEFLRFVRDEASEGRWRPAAGSFSSWPSEAAEITYCDPCCGSGHFLVEALHIIVALRQREEGLTAVDAVVAVLRDNLHGLEIDGRCVQIAAFNVALAAWKIAGGPITLPSPQIAWVGAPPPMPRIEMANLAEGDVSLRRALESLHDQFTEAPLLGSLMDIGAKDLFDADLLLRSETAMLKLRDAEPDKAEGAVAARGLLDANSILGQHYVLLATNVPFLGRGKQGAQLADYILSKWPDAKHDLATAMLLRLRSMAEPGGTVASVTPQNWLLLGRYCAFRQDILRRSSLCFVVVIGEHGFDSAAAAGAFTALAVLVAAVATRQTRFSAIDASEADNPDAKVLFLKKSDVTIIDQSDQLLNPKSKISFHKLAKLPLLEEVASALAGSYAGDRPRFIRHFWEVLEIGTDWRLHQTTVSAKALFAGKTEVIFWENESGAMYNLARSVRHLNHAAQNWLRGKPNWGKSGVVVSLMRDLKPTLYTGEIYDSNACAVVPHKEEHTPALWSFCSSPDYPEEVRKLDQKLNVTPASLIKIPFDLQYWQQRAAIEWPDGLPEPYSDDPTQWLFHGHPAFAESGTELHVALARLAGYRWPAERDKQMRLSELAKARIELAARLPGPAADGLLPLYATGSGQSLADRLRAMLGAAFNSPLSPGREEELVRAADSLLDKSKSKQWTIDAWLIDRAFRQHCVLFKQRPFIWQVWDGVSGGFAAFIYYHRLDRATLERLTYTVIGDWIRIAKTEQNVARVDNAERLQQAIAKIIDGERPFDIFVRWKSLSQQPIGWEPDLNDGVRPNIRPFMTAGILREQPRGISWSKDRGSDLPFAPWFKLGINNGGGKAGDRINDHHTSLAEKRAARGVL